MNDMKERPLKHTDESSLKYPLINEDDTIPALERSLPSSTVPISYPFF